MRNPAEPAQAGEGSGELANPASATAGEARAAFEAQVRGVLRDHLRELRGAAGEPQGDEVHFSTLGLDPSMMLRLRSNLESTLGVSLSPTVAWAYPSIAKLAAHLAEQCGRTAAAPGGAERARKRRRWAWRGEIRPRIVRCDLGDVRPILELLHREGWYDRTAQEIEYMLTASRRSCFKMMVGGDVVGLLLSVITPGRVAYHGGWLIDSRWRGKIDLIEGIIKFDQLLANLSAVQIGFANSRVLPFYVDHGYEALDVYSRYAIGSHAARGGRWEVRAAEDADLVELHALNALAYHDSRDALVRQFRAAPSARVLVARSAGGALGGWALMRRTRLGAVVGPCLAQDPEAAAALVSALRADAPAEQPVLLTGQVDRTDDWLQRAGVPFERQKVISTKFYRGEPGLLENTVPMYSVFGFGMT